MGAVLRDASGPVGEEAGVLSTPLASPGGP